MHKEQVTKKTLKSFGLVMGAFFSLVTGVMAYRGALGFSATAGVLAAAFSLVALTAPSWLKDIYHAWMKFAEIIGAFNTKLILGFIYVAFFTPVHLYFWITGKDPLKRKFDPGLASYWEDHVDNTKYDQQY